MIAARQIAFGKAAGAKKPYDTEIEYLESTGTQYIDTGVKTLSSSTVKVVAAATAFKHNSAIFGSIGTDATSIIRALIYQDSKQGRIFTVQSGSYGVKNAAIAYDTAFHNYIVTPTSASIDNRYHNATRSDNSVNNLFLFTFAFNAAIYPSSVRIAMCQISSSDVLVRDLIPVRVGDVGYMYDKVSGELFGNAGTGAFVLGNDL
jgi:hypothetical protein